MFCRPLLLLDHGTGGQQALRAAIALAQGLRTRLTIVHAIDERGAWIALGGGQVYAEHPQLRRHGELLLAGARDGLPADLPCCTQLVHGPRKAGRQVLDVVAEGGYDLLIAGCECRPAPGWHAFGCEAHWLVHHAPVPVVTVGDEATIPDATAAAFERPAAPGEQRRPR